MSEPLREEPNIVSKPQAAHPSAGLLFALTCLLALTFAVDVCALLVSGNGAERRDFISYWAAGQQLAHHQNPYDAAATLTLERAIGFPAPGEALIVRNPPSGLLLVAPLGYMGFRAAAVAWSLLLLGCWVASIQMLWLILGRPRAAFAVFGYRVSPAFAVALFAPALACIFYGQTALFALLGLVMFLRFHRTQPFVAGAALWLCALKPHLFLPFAVTLLLWIIATRSYGILGGAAAAVGASAAVAHVLDPTVWQQYSNMMHGVGLEHEFIPCLSIALRFAISPSSIWLQYLPAITGCVWAAIYFRHRATTWDWAAEGPLLVLVSMLVAPYAWLTDQALAAPALLLIAYRARFGSLLVLALLSSAIEAGILAGYSLHSVFYLWSAPAWLGWYLLADRRARVGTTCL